jgi:hypothetical protein
MVAANQPLQMQRSEWKQPRPNPTLQRTGGREGPPSWEGLTARPPLNSVFG